MKISADRILTTHVGSMPRPQDVVDSLFAHDRSEARGHAKFEETMRCVVAGAIAHQVESGIDIVN
jgi:5-methyltetrahydropteroyltriglutamate--homocysteine methyltransferase